MVHWIPVRHWRKQIFSFFQKFIQRSDANHSGDVGLAEFIHYVREHEKNLRLQFSNIDKNHDGSVDLSEIIEAFKELGIEMQVNEAEKLLRRWMSPFI